MGKTKVYWSTPTDLAEVMQVSRVTIYRQMNKKLKFRVNIVNGYREVRVPEEFVEKYKRFKKIK